MVNWSTCSQTACKWRKRTGSSQVTWLSLTMWHTLLIYRHQVPINQPPQRKTVSSSWLAWCGGVPASLWLGDGGLCSIGTLLFSITTLGRSWTPSSETRQSTVSHLPQDSTASAWKSLNSFPARVYAVFCFPVCQDKFFLFWVGLLNYSLLKDFGTNLLYFLHVFFLIPWPMTPCQLNLILLESSEA